MSSSDTPLMKQWREVKSRHPDSLVFFRVGDFYELFYQDAEEGARLLDITLTSRNNGASRAPLAGVPVHALDQYLQRLVRHGKRVAICEQVEDPSEAKGIVRREVVETVTPGTVLNDSLLDGRRNNFLIAVAGDATPGGQVGLAIADLSTGELAGRITRWEDLGDDLGRLDPAELLLPRGWELLGDASFDDRTITWRPDWTFEPESGREEMERHFRVHHLDGFGLPNDSGLIGALGAAVAYLRETQPSVSSALRPPRYQPQDASMALDEMTRRNLELVEPLTSGPGSRTLLDVLDVALTPMGARLLRSWLLSPLVDADRIERRQERVAALVEEGDARGAVRRLLKGIRDLERLAVRVASGRAGPRDLVGIRASLDPIPDLRTALELCDAAVLQELGGGLDALEDLAELIERALVDEPPINLGDGGVIREGFDEELDDLRTTRDGAVDWIARLQKTERERTGIGSLKVGFNKVFGYYIEVTRANLDRVPDEYQRRQTLTNAERYITPELKEWEEKVLGAEEKLAALEARVFDRVRTEVAGFTDRLHALASDVARIDVFASFADIAVRSDYTRPEIVEDFGLSIRGGRHPVVETMMPREQFIPNDIALERDSRVAIITGPNMAGKSTILRQVGLITLLAQVGSFVPAAHARVGIADRIFTRVGASDNLVRGRSTFMVEMTETAAILNGATDRSLVLLDEIGRGTSTWDGLSVATAVTEFLHDRIGAKTIFATHYHELTELAERLDGVENYSVAVRESGETIVFVRSLVRGGADRSYGVEVARLAGLPTDVIARARSILAELESGAGEMGSGRGPSRSPADQLGLFPATIHPVVERLREIDPDRMTPLDALKLLAELKDQAENPI